MVYSKAIITEGRSSAAPFAFHAHHSYVDIKQLSWNLVQGILGILCLKPNTKRNFSSFGWLVSDLWPFSPEFLVILRTFSFSLFFCYFFHIFDHISGTTCPIGLKFLVGADFGHGVLHTKFKPWAASKVVGCWIYWVVRLSCDAL